MSPQAHIIDIKKTNSVKTAISITTEQVCRTAVTQPVVSNFCQLLEHWTWSVIRYDTRCYFNVQSEADMSQLTLPHGTDN